MYRAHPQTKLLFETVAGGAIGEVRLIRRISPSTARPRGRRPLPAGPRRGSLMDWAATLRRFRPHPLRWGTRPGPVPRARPRVRRRRLRGRFVRFPGGAPRHLHLRHDRALRPDHPHRRHGGTHRDPPLLAGAGGVFPDLSLRRGGTVRVKEKPPPLLRRRGRCLRRGRRRGSELEIPRRTRSEPQGARGIAQGGVNDRLPLTPPAGSTACGPR